MSDLSLPIIDFADWHDVNSAPEKKKAVADKLVEACRTTGFVYIINHRVPSDELEQAFGWSKKLFDLKPEEKMLAPHPDGPEVHRGYSWPGLEKVSQVLGNEKDLDEEQMVKKLRQIQDCKESYEIGSEQNTDQPNIWLPEETLPGFRAFTTKFYWTCWETAQDILKALAVGLSLPDEDYLLRFHDGHDNQLRLLHYPPVPAGDLESNLLARMPSHSDWDSITMVFQDECGGLEVKSRESGEFVQAAPLKGAIVMNIGDMLMRWSNGNFLTTFH